MPTSRSMGPELLADNPPSGHLAVAQGIAIGRDLSLGRSRLCRESGVESEVDYKRQVLAEGRVMTAMNIGMQSWHHTARALERIHRECEQRGFHVDRYQMNLDRRMGLPRQFWSRAAAETGPMLETPEDWAAVGEVVPIQPHMGDMMIGSPASVDNACRALEAGVNYIGNMSQFHWQYPGWPGTDAEQVAETVKALGVMAAVRDQGAMVHSYLDDGFCAQFEDFCSYLGWALFERHVVNELIGARLSVSYGGLSHAPVTKAAMILALEAITPTGHMNAFYHGNTTAYSKVLDQNFAVMSLDVLYMTLARERAGSGAAILSVPITEPVRIPSWQEIVQVQTVARRVIDDAHSVNVCIDWQPIDALRGRLIRGGRQFFENLLNGLADLGVDIQDPLHCLLAARRLGARSIEQRFGANLAASARELDLQAAIPTDTWRDFLRQRDETRVALGPVRDAKTKSPTVVVGSADVHEYALSLLEDALEHLGVAAIRAGTSVDPDQFAQLALDHHADILLVTTHNGMALGYAEQLLTELRFVGASPTIAMGGVLNQDDGESDSPVDVRPALARLGVRPCEEVSDIGALLESW